MSFLRLIMGSGGVLGRGGFLESPMASTATPGTPVQKTTPGSALDEVRLDKAPPAALDQVVSGGSRPKHSGICPFQPQERRFTEAEKAEFFAAHPADQDFTLKSGETVKLPMHIKDMDMMQTVGIVDADQLRAELERNGVKPVALFGKAIVSLTVVRYRDSSIGPYNELIVGVLAKGEKPDGTTGTGFYMTKLYVTTPKSLEVGREAWGFPKYRADISISEPGNGTRAVNVVQAGHEIVSLSWAERGGLNANWLLPNAQTAITPRTFGSHWVDFLSLRPGLLTTFFRRSKGDTVRFDPRTGWGKMFAGFKPLLVQVSEGGIGVIQPPGEAR